MSQNDVVTQGADGPLRDRLLATVVERRATILMSGLTTIGLAVVAITVASQTWPYLWLPVELAFLAVRFFLVTVAQRSHGRRFRLFARLCLVTGVIWALWLGLAIALSLASGNMALCTLAAALSAGVAGGVTSRNAGTPIYAAVILAIIVVAFATGLLLGADGSMKAIAAFALPWALTLGVMLTQNYAVLARLVRAEQVAKQSARTDALTGVYNRTYLDEFLARPSKPEETGVLCFDLDGFKHINDRFGHHVGDFVLQEVARRATGVLRTDDALVRMGGDEFAVLLSGASLQDCDLVARRILRAVELPVVLSDGRQIHVGVSIGSACTGQRGDLPLKIADRALYNAKANGKGRHVHLAAA